MNVRRSLYFAYHRARGGQLGRRYMTLVREDAAGVPPGRQRELLARTLVHATRCVPYYAQLARGIDADPARDPEAYLERLPLLSKPVIRGQGAALHSADLASRRSFTNATGGSTGEPIRVVQDQDFWEWSVAVQMLHARWAGRELGQPEVQLWGSERDVLEGRESLSRIAANLLTRRRVFNAYTMSPAEMERFVAELNRRPPALVIAYAQALYELAGFVEERGLRVTPQRSISVTADTLHDHMRRRIERVFGCRVLNRYGSRELGDVAGQCAQVEGLHVFPWANHVEVVDDDGRRVAPGVEGDLVVTSLINDAMPMIRYRIGDRGLLASHGEGCSCGRSGQVLAQVTGRSSDTFRRRDGTRVDPGFFMYVLEFKDWVRKFQVVQRDYEDILIRIEEAGPRRTDDLEEIARQAKLVMGDGCVVSYEFPERIAQSASGKYRYTMSEVPEPV